MPGALCPLLRAGPRRQTSPTPHPFLCPTQEVEGWGWMRGGADGTLVSIGMMGWEWGVGASRSGNSGLPIAINRHLLGVGPTAPSPSPASSPRPSTTPPGAPQPWPCLPAPRAQPPASPDRSSALGSGRCSGKDLSTPAKTRPPPCRPPWPPLGLLWSPQPGGRSPILAIGGLRVP